MVCQSVCLSHSGAIQKMAECIKVLFGVETLANTKHTVLNGVPPAASAREFDVAFAKILWPIVKFVVFLTTIFIVIHVKHAAM